MEERNRVMTPALSVLARARDHMKKAVGFGEPSVELILPDVHLYTGQDGRLHAVMGMDALIDLVETLEVHTQKLSP